MGTNLFQKAVTTVKELMADASTTTADILIGKLIAWKVAFV